MNIEDLLKKSKQFIDTEKFDEARMCLLEILKEDATNKAALIMLGGSYFSLKKYAECEMVFERLILLEPAIGQFSIGLFNTLWKMAREEEALEEIKRFLTHADHDAEKEIIAQYIAIINEIENGNDPDQSIIDVQ